jgi:MraZ protein
MWDIMYFSGIKCYKSVWRETLIKYTLFCESYKYMLIGQYSHTMDPKKRLSLPSKWRKSLGKKVIMTRGLDSCIFLYETKEWEKIAEKLASQSFGNKEARDLNRFFLSGATEVEIDTAGRILIPDFLKDFSKLNEKVVLAGLYSRVEIWDEKVWNVKQEEISGKADEVASRLQEVGMI